MVTLVHRTDRESVTADRDGLIEAVEANLDAVYDELYERAQQALDDGINDASTTEEVIDLIEETGGYVRAPWCGDPTCEEPVKEAVAADIVMVPLDEVDAPDSACLACESDAETTAYFAKTY